MKTYRTARCLALPLASATLLFCVSVTAQAQHILFAETLPDAPGFLLQQATSPAPIPQGTATIKGRVEDVTGVTIPHATVTLTGPNEISIVVYSDNEGYFSIAALGAGTYNVTIASSGLESLEFPNVHLLAGEQKELPLIALPLSHSAISVTVVATPDEIASEQIHAEEKQRVLGILPNFYTTYIWNAAPLKAHHKYSLAYHSFLDPVAFIGTGITAGIEQAHNTFPGYGDGASGYAKRYGAAYADQVTGRVLGSAVFPSIFHQDPRYFYMGSGSTSKRAWYALSSGVICRGDNGHRQVNYSRILGSLVASSLANLYREKDDRTVGLTFRNTAIGIGVHAGTNLIREFLLRKTTTNIPTYAKGKPVEVASDSQ